MLVAENEAGARLLAWNAEKDDNFTCPECRTDVTLKKGKVNIHHYAHKPDADCLYGVGESYYHMSVKRDIYEALREHPDVRKCEVERSFKSCRPDVSFYVNDTPVVVEMQCSNIDLYDLDRRMCRYSELGCAQIWLIKSVKKRDDGLYSPTKWQDELHERYWGRLYVFHNDATVYPLKLSKHKRWIEPVEFYREGELIEIPGKWFEAKRLSEGIAGPYIHLVNDFSAGGTDGDLWCDNLGTDWMYENEEDSE